MHRVHQDEKAREELMLDLDEIARAGARRMLAQALEAEVEAYLDAAKDQRDSTDAPWLFAMGVPGSARSSVDLGPWRFMPPGSTTAESTSMESVGASRARSCRPTCAAHRRSL
jgi:hypothetical protein